MSTSCFSNTCFPLLTQKIDLTTAMMETFAQIVIFFLVFVVGMGIVLGVIHFCKTARKDKQVSRV